jgi:assimilatory nitrate reductase catalytic subunit
LANRLLALDAVDREFVESHTVGFDAFAAHVEAFPPDVVADATGLTVESIERVAHTIAGGERVSFWWTMGVNQSHEGTRTAQAIIDLALMTGNIGRPGTGANSITGQCNAMGSRLFANTTGLLGGHDFADPSHRAKVAAALGIDVNRIPDRPSWSYDRIVEGIHRGEIKGLWVVATNGAHSWINHTDLHDLFGTLDFLVVQDLYATTETAQRADLVLPAAGWGEKEGTFINSERRVGVIKRVAHAPGQALADFSIFKLVADAWGCGHLFDDWSSPEAVFRILTELTAGRPCDLTGVPGYRFVDERGGVQWPYPAAGADDATERRLFADGRFFHDDGRARFVVDRPREPMEPPTAAHPFVLLTGRGSSSQWHTQTRTAKSAILRELSPAGTHVEMHPDDATCLGLRPDEPVVVRSRRGSMRASLFVTPTVPCGSVFVPMHDATTNRLTFPAFDPHSRQPSYKHCAVSVEPDPGF